MKTVSHLQFRYLGSEDYWTLFQVRFPNLARGRSYQKYYLRIDYTITQKVVPTMYCSKQNSRHPLLSRIQKRVSLFIHVSLGNKPYIRDHWHIAFWWLGFKPCFWFKPSFRGSWIVNIGLLIPLRSITKSSEHGHTHTSIWNNSNLIMALSVQPEKLLYHFMLSCRRCARYHCHICVGNKPTWENWCWPMSEWVSVLSFHK